MTGHETVYNLIKSYDTITIFGHGMPDGDCYGSQIGLRELIRTTFPNKKVYAIGSGKPKLFETLAPMDEVDEETIAQSLAILVDVSCLRRVEDSRVYKAKMFCKFDHHNRNDELEAFEYPMCVDQERVAAAELIADFAFSHRMKFSKLAAEALYLGMATDSGRFTFHGTTRRTFELIAMLGKEGVDFKKVLDAAFYLDPKVKAYRNYMRKKAKKDGQTAYAFINCEEWQKFGITYQQAGDSVNALAGVGAKIYALFCEDENKETIRVELRSNKMYPVQPVAVIFGGGGHTFAAGCTLYKEGATYIDVIRECNKVRV